MLGPSFFRYGKLWICILWKLLVVTYAMQYTFIDKCQYSYTRNVLWCQVHSSHSHANHKTLNYNDSKINIRVKRHSWTNTWETNWRQTEYITKNFPLHEVHLLKITVLTKGIIKIIYNKLINRAGLLRCPLPPCFPPIMTLTVQDPAHQKHPRLDSADVGVGLD